LETISFLELNGDIILQMDKNNKIILKNYFTDSIPVIHDQVSLASNIYDPKITKLNLDLNNPPSLVKLDFSSDHPEAWLARRSLIKTAGISV